MDSAIVMRIASAIARAEGYFIAGSRPQRNHNPGNLTRDLIGKGVGKDGMFVVYASSEDGWSALETQVRMMLNNTSNVYRSDMTIAQMAAAYTTTQQAEWARNVSRALNASPDTKLNEITA